MKKAFTVLAAFALLLSLSACSSTANEESSPPPQQSGSQTSASEEESDSPGASSGSAEESSGQTDFSAPAETGSESLVVYFSWSGNTENVAKSVQSQTDSDIFEIVPATSYSDDYDTVLDVAQEEQKENARPAISGSIENIDQYDVVYVGFPNWWGDMPMILYSFLDSYDLSGKTVAPFVTSGGSGFSGTIGTIESLEPGAEVMEGLSLGSSQAAQPEEAVAQWLEELGLN